MYSAKSLEFIGDSLDFAIFRILRSVASLWNWLKNVMTHNHFVSTTNLLKRTVNKNCLSVFVDEIVFSFNHHSLIAGYFRGWKKLLVVTNIRVISICECCHLILLFFLLEQEQLLMH